MIAGHQAEDRSVLRRSGGERARRAGCEQHLPRASGSPRAARRSQHSETPRAAGGSGRPQRVGGIGGSRGQRGNGGADRDRGEVHAAVRLVHLGVEGGHSVKDSAVVGEARGVFDRSQAGD